jgi:predicted GTPase
VNIVDTPGTNALFELGHQAITERFLPHSDLVLFVTSAERPLTGTHAHAHTHAHTLTHTHSESERQIIRKIHEWDRKIVVVVNKCDMFASPEDQTEVMEYVKVHCCYTVVTLL